MATERRRVDWDVILPGQKPLVLLAKATEQASELAAFAAEVMAEPSRATVDRVLLRAVEFAREAIRVERSAIYLLDVKNRLMLGTFGTGALGETVDEHVLSYAFGDMDREIYARAEAGFAWTVYEQCPQIAQHNDETQVIGRGWVACTAIRGPSGPIGIFFNDTALTHAPVDEAKQLRIAILCSLLGRALEPARDWLVPSSGVAPEPRHPLVRDVAKLLGQDPARSCDTLAKDLKVSARRLARVFRSEAKTSIVDYRNELRLARFLERVDADAHNLLQAALDSGFGSYAQFHRVFRARFGLSPRDYLSERAQTGA